MASFEEFQDMVRRRGKRLWLAIDEMDTMLGNEELTSDFMGWQINQYFLGFLGIGSDALLSMHMKLKETSSSPFELFQIQLFTTDQTVNFFKQIEGCYRFRDSTRQAIMEYSDGAPGVLGTLIRFSIDHGKYDQEWPEWENWFKIQNFSEYLIRCVYAK